MSADGISGRTFPRSHWVLAWRENKYSEAGDDWLRPQVGRDTFMVDNSVFARGLVSTPVGSS